MKNHVISIINGHKIFRDKRSKIWRYSDTHDKVKGNERKCDKCGKFHKIDLYDACDEELEALNK